MKVTEVKRTLIIFIVTLSLLSFFLLAVLIVSVSFDKELDESKIRNVEEGRYYRLDLSANETSVGFVRRYSTEERIIYDDEGIVHYFSEIGGEDEDTELYECSGTCYCDEDFELVERRSDGWGRMIAKSFVVIIGLKFVEVTGMRIKTVFDRRFEKKCAKMLDGVCADVFVRSKLDSCSPVESKEEVEDIFGSQKVKVKKVKRVICKGSCLPTALAYQLGGEDMEKECRKLSLTTVFNQETISSLENTEFYTRYVRCYEKAMKAFLDDYEKKEPERLMSEEDFHRIFAFEGCFKAFTVGVYGFFAEHFLKDFCLEGKVNIDYFLSPDLQYLQDNPTCQAWKDQISFLGKEKVPRSWDRHARLPRWTRKEWKEKNKSVGCVIKTVKE